jgi:hypothetical protein
MEPPAAHGTDSATESRFVTEADWIPGFWNYLLDLDLDRDDLIAELIQNDLDQDATQTVISFERDKLIGEGNGRPVERPKAGSGCGRSRVPATAFPPNGGGLASRITAPPSRSATRSV